MNTAGVETPLVSVVILNYKRRDALVQSLDSVLRQEYSNREIILVDNHSDDGIREFVECLSEPVRLIELDENRGACGGRNAGLREAHGDIIVTLDNDIYFDSPFELSKVVQLFHARPDVHVLAFQLCDAASGALRVREWCHPRNWKEFGQSEFETNFFVEGACACRREVYETAGLYFEPLFIGCEGHDLALRILDHEFRILYCPQIRACHLMSPITRTRERPYYFYTRNYIWIAFKDYSVIGGFCFLQPKLLMMSYFTLRSGCYGAFLKGLWDGLRGLPEIHSQRTQIKRATVSYMNGLERGRPGWLTRLARHSLEPQIRSLSQGIGEGAVFRRHENSGVFGGMIFFYLLVSVMPLARHPLWSQFVGDLTLTKYVGIVCLVYALIHLANRRSLPTAFAGPLLQWFGVFYLMMLISYLTKSDPSLWEMNPLLSYTSFLVLFFITATVVDSIPRLRSTMLVAIGSMAFASLYVIREWQKFHNLFPGFRPGWVVGDPNYFALSVVLCMPFAFYMFWEESHLPIRLFSLGCLLLMLTALTLSGSRGGFLGLVAASLFLIWRSRRRVRNLVLLTALAVPLFLVAPASPLLRLLHPAYQDVSAEDSRLELWRAGLRMIAQHPMTGIGLGNYKGVVTHYEADDKNLEKIAHNTYIELAAETGLPGLCAFLIILFCAFRNLERARHLASEHHAHFLELASQSIAAGLIGSLVAIFFLSAETQKLLWLMVLLSPCLRSLAIEAEDTKDPVEDKLLEEPARREMDLSFDEANEVKLTS